MRGVRARQPEAMRVDGWCPVPVNLAQLDRPAVAQTH